ncbi:MAG: hypothetical protein ACFHXK_11785 [bacterium]
MTNVPNHRRLTGMLLIMTLASPLSYAQDKPVEGKNDATQDTARAQTEKKPADPHTQEKDKDRDAEIFRPSEEISEDFAVSFPVDI